jgi:hypothetical protein
MELSGRFYSPPQPLLNQGSSIHFVGALHADEEFT